MRLIIRSILLLFIVTVLALAAFRVTAFYREDDRRDLVLPGEGRLIDVAGAGIYVEEQGPESGTPILLIHGSVGWAGLWRETSAVLAEEGYRAIAFDTPPMGYSDRDPRGGYGRIRQAERIEALVATLGVRPIVVAHSFGAGPALEAVLRKPDAFAGLVVVSGAIGMGGHNSEKGLPLPLRPLLFREAAVSATVTNPWAMEPLLGLFLHRKDSVTPEQIDILNQPMRLRHTTEALAGWLPSLLVAPKDALSTRPEEIAKAGIPVALIWGDRDTTTPLEQGRALQDALSDAPLLVLEEVGHIPQIEDPDGFHTRLLEALLAVDPSGG